MFRIKGNVVTVGDYFIFCIFFAFLLTIHFWHLKQQQLLTLTAEILLFLQLEVAIFAGVA